MVGGRAHLCEDVVEPLEGAPEVDFDPARGRGHVLTVVLSAPALHERHPEMSEPSLNQFTEATENLTLIGCSVTLPVAT